MPSRQSIQDRLASAAPRGVRETGAHELASPICRSLRRARNSRGLLTGVFAAVALALHPVQAIAEEIPLGEISEYLDGLVLAEAQFTQVADDGRRSSGRLWMSRPGRMRMDYDPPEKAQVIVVANGVHVVDGRSNEPPAVYPLKQTPLRHLLARDIDLEATGHVVGHRGFGDATVVALADPEKPAAGRIELLFTPDPVELRMFTVTDESGAVTAVILDSLDVGREQPPGHYRAPRQESDR